MAIGREGSERGGVIDAVDVRGAGSMEWAELVGVPVDHPLVGGGTMPYNIEDAWSRVVTTPAGQAGPASDTIATPEGGAGMASHWSEVFNFKGSAVPWLLLAILAIVLMVHFTVNAEGGALGRHLRAGASFS